MRARELHVLGTGGRQEAGGRVDRGDPELSGARVYVVLMLCVYAYTYTYMVGVSR